MGCASSQYNETQNDMIATTFTFEHLFLFLINIFRYTQRHGWHCNSIPWVYYQHLGKTKNPNEAH